jgi:adenylyltransferase/sulfurtransferase
MNHAAHVRYARQRRLPEFGEAGQQRLAASKVLIVGAGGLGSPAALYLAAAGVGTLGLVDDDVVDETNLHRQLLYGTADVGRPKLDAAVSRLANVNPLVRLVRHDARLGRDNARAILRDYDIVLDGTDTFAARYAINDACVALGLPFVYGSVARFEGQVSVFAAPDGPCYRCLFPVPPAPGSVPTCAEEGVLGVLPGLVGMWQATEVLKWCAGLGASLAGRLLLVDALSARTLEIAVPRQAGCPACGSAGAGASEAASHGASQSVSQDASQAASQGMSQSVSHETSHSMSHGMSQSVSHDMSQRMSQSTSQVAPAAGEDVMPDHVTPEALHTMRAQGAPLVLLDVREPSEHVIAAIAGSRLLPFGTVAAEVETLDRSAHTVVYCHRGTRSTVVAEWLREQGFARVQSLRGGIDAWSVAVDGTVPRY